MAPASADALSSAAAGCADDVVSALVLAGVPRVAWAPATNTAMWRHPATERNAEVLRGFGHALLGPNTGRLAPRGGCSPEDLDPRLSALFKPQDLRGLAVLVSAGPTRKYLDPVRFLSNPSRGEMGYAVAAARDRGATVTLVSGPSALTPPHGVAFVPVESAEAMRYALAGRFERCDMLVMSAAVADWRARTVAVQKEAKLGEAQTLELVRTPDILSKLAPRKRRQVTVGFAMETDQGIARAADKARRKGLDFICLNYPASAVSAFGGDANEVTFVTPEGEAEALPLLPKLEVAERLLDRATRILASCAAQP